MRWCGSLGLGDDAGEQVTPLPNLTPCLLLSLAGLIVSSPQHQEWAALPFIRFLHKFAAQQISQPSPSLSVFCFLDWRFVQAGGEGRPGLEVGEGFLDSGDEVVFGFVVDGLEEGVVVGEEARVDCCAGGAAVGEDGEDDDEAEEEEDCEGRAGAVVVDADHAFLEVVLHLDLLLLQRHLLLAQLQLGVRPLPQAAVAVPAGLRFQHFLVGLQPALEFFNVVLALLPGLLRCEAVLDLLVGPVLRPAAGWVVGRSDWVLGVVEVEFELVVVLKVVLVGPAGLAFLGESAVEALLVDVELAFDDLPHHCDQCKYNPDLPSSVAKSRRLRYRSNPLRPPRAPTLLQSA